MVLILIILSLLLPGKSVAQGILPDEFIGQYDPDITYQSGSEYIDTLPVQRMPLHESIPQRDTQTALEILPRDDVEEQQKSSRVNPLFSPLHTVGIDMLAVVSFSVLISLLQQINKAISSLRSRIRKSIHQSAGQAHSPPGTAQQIAKLPPALTYGENSLYLSRFYADPASGTFPTEVQEVLSWDQRWNPELYPQDYLQCTTYVAITYHLNGITLKGRLRGDARNWIHLTDTFTVYRSGASSSPPQPMDTMVWAEGAMNHVGIVTQVRNHMITVANGNSTAEYHSYRYRTAADGKIEITSVNGETAQSAWVPSHWLRPKESL